VVALLTCGAFACRVAFSAGYAAGKTAQAAQPAAVAAAPLKPVASPREGVCDLIFDHVGNVLDEEQMQDELRIQEFQAGIPADYAR